MINQDLISFVRGQIARGTSETDIYRMLMTSGGWTRSDISEAFSFIKSTPTRTITPPAPTPLQSVATSQTATPTGPLAPAQTSQPVQSPPIVSAPKPAPQPVQPIVQPLSPKPIAPAPQQPLQKFTGPTFATSPVASAPAVTPSWSAGQPLAQPMQSAVIMPVHFETAPQRKKSKALFVAIVALLVLVGGGGAYAYQYYFHPTPEKLLSAVLDNVQNVKSFNYELTSTVSMSMPSFDPMPRGDAPIVADGNTAQLPAVEIPQKKGPVQTMIFNIKGTTDATDENNVKSETAFHMTSTMLPIKLVLDLNAKYLNQKFFIQVPELGVFATGMNPDFKSGDWLYATTDEIAKMLSDFEQDTTGAPVLSSEDIKNKFNSKNNLAFLKLLRENDIVAVTGEIDPMKENNRTYRRFGFTLANDKLGSALEQLYGLKTFSSSSQNEIKNAISDFIRSFALTNGELWIDSTSRLPYKIAFTLVTKTPESLNFDLSIQVAMTFTDYGNITPIVEPKDPKSLYTTVYTSLQTARQKATDAKIKSNLSSLRAEAEVYYSKVVPNNSYKGFCTSIRAQELIHSTENSIGAGKVICTAGNFTWKTYAPLITDPTKYFCVDSTGNALEITKIPTGFACN